MATANCTLLGYSCFNNGWNGTDTSPYINDSTSHPCWGYDSGSRLRYLVLGFKMPTAIGVDKSITFTIKAFSTSANPTVTYMVSSQGANYAGTDDGGRAAAEPTNILASGTAALTLAAQTYANVTITVDADALTPGTTYYLWTTVKANSAGYCGKYTSTPWSASLTYTPGVVYVDTGTTWKQAIPYIDTGTTWKQAIPYVDTGTTWKIGG